MLEQAVRFLKYAKSRVRRRHFIYGFIIVGLLLVSSISLFNLSPYRDGDNVQYFRAKILATRNEVSAIDGASEIIEAKLLDGPQKQQTVEISWNANFGDKTYNNLPVSSEILLTKSKSDNSQYSIVSRWYMPGIATLLLLLLILVIIVGAWRGITSILGLTISIFVLTSFILPRILEGNNAFITCIEGSMFIILVSVFVAHGVNKRTTIAFVSSLLSLVAIIGLTVFATHVTGVSEVIDEQSVSIFSSPRPIDVAGLLTGGVVVASLGTLFDITTGQAASVDEIHKANRRQTSMKLFMQGMSVGREHVAALINTLALVYAGVALPSIVTATFLLQDKTNHIPLLVNINSETIAEEVVRTSVASIGLLLAMPLTTALAAYVLPRWNKKVDAKVRRWLKMFWT